MKVSELIAQGQRPLKRASHRFSASGDEREQARLLLEHVLGKDPDASLDDEVGIGARRRFEGFVARRTTGEPLEYITGKTEFMGMRLAIKRGAFVPRATTEFLAEQAIKRVRRRQHPIAVDIATGLGPVALAVARAVPKAEVHGVDLTHESVAQARANARSLRLKNVSFHRGDLFSPLPRDLKGAVDVVTIHPPYVGRDEVRTLPAELRRFEPACSLTDRSVDGMGLVHRVADEARDWLASGGWLLIEIGSSSARAVRSVLTRAEYRDVASTVGKYDYTRVLVARH